MKSKMFLLVCFLWAFNGTITFAEVTEFRVAVSQKNNSQLAKAIKQLERNLERASNGSLKLKVYYDYSESQIPAQIKSGQLDGGFLSSEEASGLGLNMGILEVPGLVKDWVSAEKILNYFTGLIKQDADIKGYKLLGIHQTGLVRIFSKQKVIMNHQELKNTSVYLNHNNNILPIMSGIIGFLPKRAYNHEVKNLIQNSSVNTLFCTGLEAQAYGGKNISYTNELVISGRYGGFVLRKGVFEKLSGTEKRLMEQNAVKVSRLITKKFKSYDEKAYRKITSGKSYTRLSKDGLSEWDQIFSAIRRELAKKTFPASWIKKIEQQTK